MTLSRHSLRQDIVQAVRLALDEDIGSGDITAELIPPEHKARAWVITREPCVVCGQPWFEETFSQVGQIDHIRWLTPEGAHVEANTRLVELRGLARNLLTGERTALNFLQLLSGTATTAQAYAKQIPGDDPKVLDTRKTIPGLRSAQKYAVEMGGCQNHRMGLWDAYLIKENHVEACGGIAQAINKARERHPQKTVEVEVENIQELTEALACKADIVMLDNFDAEMLKEAFTLKKGNTLFELSGNITLEDLEKGRKSAMLKNIDLISIGALTKHLKSIDLSFQLATIKD